MLQLAGLYVSLYDPEKRSYEENGVLLTRLFVRLRELYRDIQSSPTGSDLSVYQTTLKQIEDEISKVDPKYPASAFDRLKAQLKKVRSDKSSVNELRRRTQEAIGRLA